PAAAEPERPSRTAALAALKKSDAEERRRGARGLAIVGRMEDAPKLITALRDADERVRAVAEQALWAVWSRSGNARVDDLLSRGVAEMGEQRFPEAIATFTRIIELKPGFAEGWNKRATAYFLAGEFRRSLMDCDEVIKRNPQHFGVLSGYGQIYLRLDQPEKALEYFRRALAVNPAPDRAESSGRYAFRSSGRRRAALRARREPCRASRSRAGSPDRSCGRPCARGNACRLPRPTSNASAGRASRPRASLGPRG